MKLSVVVPVYKVEKYLKQCVESLINQHFDDYEVILVDDGSNDGSPVMCDEFAKKYKNIITIHKDNGGPTSARMAGAAVAHGDYIICVDGDDYIENHFFEKICSIISCSHDADIIICSYYLHDGKTDIKVDNLVDEGLYCDDKIELIRERFPYDSHSRGINLNAIVNSVWSKIVKRSLYVSCQKLIPEKIKKGEDTFLSLLLLNKCSSLYISRYAGYYYRIVEGSLSKTINPIDFSFLEELLSCMRDVCNEMKINDNGVRVYGFSRLSFLVSSMSKTSVNMRDFSELMTNLLKDFDFSLIFPSKVAKPRFRDLLKIDIIKHKRWRLFYFLKKVFN